VFAISLGACADDGVPDSKKLTELTVAEAKDACLELQADYPERTVTCGTITITIGLTVAECNDETPAPAACTATVGDARACNSDLYKQTDAELCADGPLPASCAKLTSC